jgi:hypothetical protein
VSAIALVSKVSSAERTTLRAICAPWTCATGQVLWGCPAPEPLDEDEATSGVPVSSRRRAAGRERTLTSLLAETGPYLADLEEALRSMSGRKRLAVLEWLIEWLIEWEDENNWYPRSWTTIRHRGQQTLVMAELDPSKDNNRARLVFTPVLDHLLEAVPMLGDILHEEEQRAAA